MWQLLLVTSCQGTYRTSACSDDRVCQLSTVPVSLRKSFPACCKLSGSHGYVDVVSLLLGHEVVSPSVLFLILTDHYLVSKCGKRNTQTQYYIPEEGI